MKGVVGITGKNAPIKPAIRAIEPITKYAPFLIFIWTEDFFSVILVPHCSCTI
jgi:hypothetical protein